MIDLLPMGQQSLFGIIISLMVLTIVWWSIQSFKFDLFLKNPDGVKAKVLLVMVALALTHIITRFLLDYLEWSTNLRYLF